MSIPTWLLGLSPEQYVFIHISWVSVIVNVLGAICITALLVFTPKETSWRKWSCCVRFVSLMKWGLLEGRCSTALPSFNILAYIVDLFSVPYNIPGRSQVYSPASFLFYGTYNSLRPVICLGGILCLLQNTGFCAIVSISFPFGVTMSCQRQTARIGRSFILHYGCLARELLTSTFVITLKNSFVVWCQVYCRRML